MGIVKIGCFLVIAKARGRDARAVRVTQSRPQLAPDEALLRLSIELPEDAFDAPLITVPVQKRQVAVAVEVDEA